MKTVNVDLARSVKDASPSANRIFNDVANNLWRDNLNFNIFDSSGYLTEDAKNFIRSNEIEKNDNQTWGDAILSYAEMYDLGYQCDKAPKKRSDVKFSGSMIMSSYMKAQEDGNEYRQSSGDGDFEEGIDLIEELTLKSYQ